MMTVLEYAQDLKRSVTEILIICKELNIRVNSQDDYLNEEAIIILDNYFQSLPQVEETEEVEEVETAVEAKVETTAKNDKKGKKSKKTKENDKEEHKKAKKEMYKNKEKLISNVPSKSEEEELDSDTIWYEEGMTVGQFAENLGVAPVSVIKSLMGLGKMATINNTIDFETAELVAIENGKLIQVKKQQDVINFENIEIDDDASMLVERPCVVTIMGHVDHGKTTLLDTIRSSRVTEGEFGGITQHIGAYQIEYNSKKVTFLDTPGHEAFTQMRARGAQVTDIAIIVVAADDGVMPQTREAIDHAIAAGVPIIVAVNKMDKPSANPDRVMTELSNFNLVPEEWGGSTIFTRVSAKFNQGIDELLENILLIAEMEELKANPNRYAMGTVIEAELDKGRGPVATLLVQNGTLRVGDPVVVGHAYGRIRSMVNDLGKELVEALPSTPVEITGLNDVPSAGDKFMAFESEKVARQIGEERTTRAKLNDRKASSAMSLDELFNQIEEGDIKEINVILKADVQGSAEAVKAALERIEVKGVKVRVIRSGVGAITESDILLAAASNTLIIGFNVRPDAKTRDAAIREGVEIRLHNIIYKAVEEMEAAMNGMLDPEYKEVVTGQAVVRETFKVSKVGTIAGSFVTDGYIKRDSKIRLIREGIVIYEGSLGSIKRFKDDVKEVKAGYECGLMIDNFNDLKVDDVIEAFIMEEVKR